MPRYKEDINDATYDELLETPHINAVRAQQIIDYRDSVGVINHMIEIHELPGIGPRLYQLICMYYKV